MVKNDSGLMGSPRKIEISSPQGYRDAFDSFAKDFAWGAGRPSVKEASQVFQIACVVPKKVARFDRDYVSAVDLGQSAIMKFAPDDDGKFTTDEFKGRRTLVFSHLTTGDRFFLVGSSRTRTILEGSPIV